MTSTPENLSADAAFIARTFFDAGSNIQIIGHSPTPRLQAALDELVAAKLISAEATGADDTTSYEKTEKENKPMTENASPKTQHDIIMLRAKTIAKACGITTPWADLPDDTRALWIAAACASVEADYVAGVRYVPDTATNEMRDAFEVHSASGAEAWQMILEASPYRQ